MLGPAPKGYQITEFMQAEAAFEKARQEASAASTRLDDARKVCEAAKVALAKAYDFNHDSGPINIPVPGTGKVIRLSSRGCRRGDTPYISAVIERLAND